VRGIFVLRLRFSARRRNKRVKDLDAGRLEVRHVARHHDEAAFESGGGDLKISAVMTERCAQLSPATGGRQIERQNAVAVDLKDLVEPHGKHGGKISVLKALQSDPTLDRANADDADKEIARR